MAKNKRLKKAYESVDGAKAYALTDAIKLVKSNAKAKFDETVEMSMNLGIDPRHADQMVRGLTSLPNGTGTIQYVLGYSSGSFHLGVFGCSGTSSPGCAPSWYSWSCIAPFNTCSPFNFPGAPL